MKGVSYQWVISLWSHWDLQHVSTVQTSFLWLIYSILFSAKEWEMWFVNQVGVSVPDTCHLYGLPRSCIKKAEHQRIDAFELWCWGRLLRVPWTARRLNHSILKEISPEYSLGRLMLKLKLQSFGHLIWRTDSLEKALMLGKIEGRRRRGWQRMRWMASLTRWTWAWASSRSWWWTGKPDVLQSLGSQTVGHYWATELNWKKLDGVSDQGKWRMTSSSLIPSVELQRASRCIMTGQQKQIFWTTAVLAP